VPAGERKRQKQSPQRQHATSTSATTSTAMDTVTSAVNTSGYSCIHPTRAD
jgi:hypothetical protein